MDFMNKRIIFSSQIRLITIDLNQIFPMKPSELEISLSVESFEPTNLVLFNFCLEITPRYYLTIRHTQIVGVSCLKHTEQSTSVSEIVV